VKPWRTKELEAPDMYIDKKVQNLPDEEELRMQSKHFKSGYCIRDCGF
jgi:hypothetical protein